MIIFGAGFVFLFLNMSSKVKKLFQLFFITIKYFWVYCFQLRAFEILILHVKLCSKTGCCVKNIRIRRFLWFIFSIFLKAVIFVVCIFPFCRRQRFLWSIFSRFARSVEASQRNSVVVGSNLTQANFL